jgi:hypothetical protein
MLPPPSRVPFATRSTSGGSTTASGISRTQNPTGRLTKVYMFPRRSQVNRTGMSPNGLRMATLDQQLRGQRRQLPVVVPGEDVRSEYQLVPGEHGHLRHDEQKKEPLARQSQAALKWSGGGGNCTRVPRSFGDGLYVRSRSFDCRPGSPDRQGLFWLSPSWVWPEPQWAVWLRRSRIGVFGRS